MRGPDDLRPVLAALRRGPGRTAARVGLPALAALAAACAPGPSPETGPTPALPEIPEVRGELELYVAYPDAGDPIAATDSNFVFGTTGTGAAELTIDDRPVDVEPNGAFLAWLPVPERSAGDTARYRLVARAGGRADTLVHPVRLPPGPYEEDGSVWVDTAALAGLGERWGPAATTLERAVRAATGLEAWVEVASADGRAPRAADPADTLRRETVRGDTLPNLRLPLEEVRVGTYRLRTELGLLASAAGARGAGKGADTLRLALRATDGRDTASAEGTLAVRVLDPRRPPVATLAEEPDSVHGAAGSVPGRPSPRGSYAWLLPPGSSAPVDRRVDDRVRLRLGPDLHAWVAAEDVRVGGSAALPPDRPAPVARVGLVSAEPLADRIRLRIPVGRRLPAHAEATGRREVRLVVHGGLSGTERMLYGEEDPLLRSLRWQQEPGPRWELRVRLSEPVWGLDLRWDGVERPRARPARAVRLPDPGERGTLVLEVRRPPEIDADEPLDGLRVAVDPGHPPVGAEGPTGLTEAEANLGVARELGRLLSDAGADPILVRDDGAAVGLYERRDHARSAGADLLVSIHNNALPDGTRPFGREGTSTYYFHPHARLLARYVQGGMLETMGLRDLGVRWGNLALPREAWMPTVLTEGAFMMFPRHEAALRSRSFREAYARGVLEGLRRFLRAHAAGDGA